MVMVCFIAKHETSLESQVLDQHRRYRGFPGGSANAGDAGLIPGSGRSPGEGNSYSSILAWRIPRTEEPGGLQSMGSQRVVQD